MLSEYLLSRSEHRIQERAQHSRFLLIPSVIFFLIYGFVLGTAFWSLGLSMPPAVLAGLTTVVFTIAAGLGVRYREQEVWAEATADLTRLRSRFLGQFAVLQVVARVVFSLPTVAFDAMTGLFPRRPRLDRATLVLATNVAAALDEIVSVRELKARVSGEFTPKMVDEAVLLLDWAEAGRVVRRDGELSLMPGPGRDRLLRPLHEANPTIVHLSVLL